MARWTLLLLAALAACTGDGVLDAADATGPEDPSAATRAPSRIEAAADSIVQAGNLERSARGLPTLSVDPALASVAQAHAQDMALRGYLDHVSPEGQGPGDRLRMAGLHARVTAENITLHRSASDAMAAWMDSRGHRSNILLHAFQRTGVGVYWSPASPETVYFVQLFSD